MVYESMSMVMFDYYKVFYKQFSSEDIIKLNTSCNIMYDLLFCAETRSKVINKSCARVFADSGIKTKHCR